MYQLFKDFNMLHGMHIRNINGTDNDAIVAAIKNIHTGEKRLHILRNPKYEFWITKKGLRKQENRLECESLNNLDTYVCEYRHLWKTIGGALGDLYPGNYPSKYSKDPHIYGLDVSPLVRLKTEYMRACNGVIPRLDIGMLDIETGVIDGFENCILCASYTDWRTRTTYEFIDAEWCDVSEEALASRMSREMTTFVDGLNTKAKAVWDKNKHTFKYVLCKDERELIIKLIATAIACKPDLCGVWNIAFDIPHIERRALFYGIDLALLFCHPDVPSELKMYAWKQDQTDVEHFTDVWHQVLAPGYTRWYDPMCAYSRLRKVQGRENFYTLEYISSKIIGSGKMKFGVNASHADMQTKDKIGYCIYNCFDTILPCVIDEVSGDTSSMMVLVDISELSEFSKQTVMLRNQWYNYCRYTINSIPGCVPGGSTMGQEYDKYLWNIGGAVLSPNLLETRGSRHLKESGSETALHLLVNDIDATLVERHWRLFIGNYELKTSLIAGTL